MENRGHPKTMSCRVDESQLVRVDAAALLVGQVRSTFVASATLKAADDVLRSAVGQMATSAETIG